MLTVAIKRARRILAKNNGLLIGLMSGLLSVSSTTALGWDFARVPLFWNTGVNPNVVFVADTSGSMQWMTTSEAYNRDMAGSKTYAGLDSDKAWQICSSSTLGSCSTWTLRSGNSNVNPLRDDDLQWGFRTPTFSWSRNGASFDGQQSRSFNTGPSNGICGASATRVDNRYICGLGGLNLSVGDPISFSWSGSNAPFNRIAKDTTYFVSAINDFGIRVSNRADLSNSIDVTVINNRAYTATKGVPTYELDFDSSYVGTGLNTFGASSNIQMCNVNPSINLTNLGSMSTGVTVTGQPPALKPEDIGVWMRKGSNAPNCVRFKEASTAQSPTTDGTLCNSHNACGNYPESIDVMTPYLSSYINFLLNKHVGAKTNQRVNFSDTQLFPDSDPDLGNFTESDYSVIPPQNRIQAMREGLQQVILSNSERMHIGLFKFDAEKLLSCDANDDLEAQMTQLIGTNIDILQTPVSATDGLVGGLRANGGTPLAHTTYEAIAYLQGQPGQNTGTTRVETSPTGCGNRGKSPCYEDVPNTYSSPIKYRCQKNYVIVLTDGDPSGDSVDASRNSLNTAANNPNNNNRLNNWDGIADGNYLDDVAQFAYDVDFKRDGDGVDAGGKSWDDTSFDRKWVKQNIETFTIGFALENSLMKDTPLTNTVSIPSSDVDGSNKRLKLKSHGLSTGDYILYTGPSRGDLRKHTSDSSSDGKYYAVQTEDADYFRVASSPARAQSCAAGNLSNCMNLGSGSSAMTFSTGPGKSFFPQTAEELARDLDSVFSRINRLVSSASAVATNSKRLGADSLVYQARFDTEGWSGEIAAYQVNLDDGTVDTSEGAEYVWSTNSTLSNASQRGTMLTWNSAEEKAVVFERANLSAEQQSYLGDDELTQNAVVSWLKGNNVINPAGFRARPKGLLGDIINSDPVYVGAFNYGYNQLPASGAGCQINGEVSTGSDCTGAETYNAYITGSAKSRTPMLYVGANDGMLHGIVAGADGGQERLAYIPRGVYYDWTDVNNNGRIDPEEKGTVIKKFHELTQEGYDHRYFVDGAPFGGDAFVNGQWRSFISGGSGTGGRSVYLIDVTDPSSFSANNVIWDFEHENLGLTMSNTIITRLPNGKWYSVFGNGLNSGGHKASIFMVNIEDHTDYLQLETGVGGTGEENGMMSVQVRVDADRNAIAIYGADIRGNIWRFNTDGMTSANASAPRSHLVFTAKDASGNLQPITGGIRIGRHPTGLGSLVYFGTGKYFETIDKDYKADSLPRHDTFYAILDDGSDNPSIIRGDLTQQEFIPLGTDYRTATKHPVDFKSTPGWFIDLKAGANQGEKVVTTPVLSGSRIIFVSMLPAVGDRCISTGSSWLNELDALTGAMLDTPPLDTNNDGRVNSEDDIVASALLDGYASEPLIISAGEVDFKLMGSTSTTKSVITIAEAPPRSAAAAGGRGRMSWQQLQ